MKKEIKNEILRESDNTDIIVIPYNKNWPPYMDYDGVKAEMLTEFSRGMREDREFLCIIQEGNRVYLTKSMVERLPTLAIRWKIQ